MKNQTNVKTFFKNKRENWVNFMLIKYKHLFKSHI